MTGLLLKTLPALAVALAGLLVQADAQGLTVSSGSGDYASSPRAAAVAQLAGQIVNGPRALPIDGVMYPLYYGPQPIPNTLAYKLQTEQVQFITSFVTERPLVLASLAANMSASLVTPESYTELYGRASSLIERPMSMDNSDETFGAQRLTIKSFALRKATPSDVGNGLALPDATLRDICGMSAAELSSNQALFVEDFSNATQYNDPARPDKYVPNVVGFFCASATKGLRPVEIRLLDTKLTYTPLDTRSEWTLAKMALEAASANYHQWQHMVETHAVIVPLRVEAMRVMSDKHPVRALVERHVYMDFGLEMLAGVILLNKSTEMDLISGWGATGSTRFLYAQTQKGVSIKQKAFRTDLTLRGIDTIKSHKYATYGALYDDAIATFTKAFVDAYYPTDAAVVDDIELQNWANASSVIPHVRDFPTKFESKERLRELLTHLIFTSSVRHHGMNGQATWHATSAPFAPAALWKPLPTAKLGSGAGACGDQSARQDELNVLAYTAPLDMLPHAVDITSFFYREVPTNQSFYSAYNASVFATETKLAPAISAFGATMQTIEKTISDAEKGAKWPYLLLRPSQMAFFSWI